MIGCRKVVVGASVKEGQEVGGQALETVQVEEEKRSSFVAGLEKHVSPPAETRSAMILAHPRPLVVLA